MKIYVRIVQFLIFDFFSNKMTNTQWTCADVNLAIDGPRWSE